MEKRARYLTVILIIFLIILISLVSLKFTGYLVKEPQKQVQFYFYDKDTNCPLNGYVFIGDKLIGKSINGFFNLTYENYQVNFKNLNKDISLFGKLGGCFNSDLFFDKYWQAFEIQDYYFNGEPIFNFKTAINPNNPVKRELIGFIQPDKVKNELNNINLNENQNTLESLSKINNYLNNKINYKKDWDFNKQTNYWQTLEQTLNVKTGDCEDYSTTLLSLFLSYNNSLNCYNIIFTSHVTIFCHINSYYIYYDQEKTELKKQASTKQELLELKQDYFEHYGIDENNNTESKAHFAFNNNLFVEFKEENDFINWQYSLESKKSEQDLFQILEQRSIEAEELYNEQEYGELATQSPSTQLPTTKPTLKGFFIENPLLLIILSIIFIILIIILIKINKQSKKKK